MRTRWALRTFGPQAGATRTRSPSTFTGYVLRQATGFRTFAPVRTSYCQPCHGHVTTLPSRSPSPPGPPPMQARVAEGGERPADVEEGDDVSRDDDDLRPARRDLPHEGHGDEI